MTGSALVFVDTNVLLATFDDANPARQAKAREWVSWCWRTRTGRISTQVLNELYNNAITRFRQGVSAHQARTQVRRLRLWQPPHLDRHTVDGAWDLQDRYGLGYWDALIVSSAHQQGCTHVLSDAFEHGRQFDAVTILDPSRSSPQELENRE